MRKSKKSHLLRHAARTALIDSLESRLLFTVLPTGFGETLVAANIVSPTSMAFAPDGRLFVAEKSGALRVIKNGALLAAPFVTVTASTFSERGLGGVAIDPQFADNGFVYVYYTAETPAAHNRISRFTMTPGGDVALPGSEQVILDLPDAGNGTAHNGGAMQFLPDGTLLVGVGDHTNSLNGQDMNTPFGKILRINADGSIPNDNPFYNSASGINRAIWSLGVRNPFTMDVQPGTGRVFINDVGNAAWEEINEGAPGRNFGWSTTEGPFDPLAYPDFTNPFHAYDHTQGAAVTGGAFYNPPAVQFPAENVGQYFFADFGSGFIRRLNPHDKVVTPFGTEAFGVVDLDVGPDGSLYWLSRFDNAVYRISATLAPQVSSHPQSQLISVGEPVTFSVVASGASLSYQWQRDGVDIAGANGSSYSLATTALPDSGSEFRCVISNLQGSTMSNTATLTVTADQPPVPTVLTPAAGTTYRGGMNVSYSGAASDNEDGALDGARMTWWVDFHHADHIHPFLPPTTGATGGEFEIPTLDHAAANVWYRINLSVTDSAGFTRTTYRDLQPQLATITVQSSHPGLQVAVDGQPKPSPIVMTGVVNTIRTLSAAQIQQVGGLSYDFVNWSHGGAATHQIFIPETDTTYTANYQPFTTYYLSDRDWVSQSGYFPPTRDGNQWGSPITIEGVVYPRGLGVSSYSDVTYALGGAFERFKATVGVDDIVGALGTCSFEVYVDGIKRFDSGPMTGTMGGIDLDVDVTGASTLRLFVNPGDDGPNSDQADWAEARLVNYTHAAPDAPQQLAATAPNYNRVALTWKDRSTDEASFSIERSIDNVNFSEIGSVAAGVTSFVDAYRDPSTTYYYRVRARNAIGDSPYTPVASATTGVATLEAPWSEMDVGDILPAWSGSASQDAGAITITGSGLGIGTEADAMHFVYQQMDGDGSITARLSSWTGMNFESAAAGVMIRQSLDANARSAAMLLSAGPSASTVFVRREITGGDTLVMNSPHKPAPHWVRLERAGNTFTAYTSADGMNFTVFWDPVQVAMGASVYVGLAITATSASNTSTATFDNITVANSTPTIVNHAAIVPNPVTGTSAALSVLGADDDGEAGLSYTWSVLSKPAGAVDPTFSVNGTNAAKETTATFAKAGAYSLRVRISDGTRFADSRVDFDVEADLTSISLTPASVTIPRTVSQPFTAVALDQFGDPIPVQPSFQWAVTAGDGSITDDGVYTAPNQAGNATIAASLPGEGLTATADITIVQDSVAISQPPAATPNPVTGVSTLLWVLGSGDAGESALTYTWAATSLPPGAAVTFSANGTNEAKNATATFDRAGSYTLTVTVSDGAALASAEVIVAVEQTAQTIELSPGVIQLSPGEACQYSAVVSNQFGQPMTAAVMWAATGDGSITADGLYTAGPAQGTYQISATVGGVTEIIDVVVDFTGPTVTWNGDAAPHPAETEWFFHVTYTDAHGVDVATLGGDDITVTAPGGATYAAEFVSGDLAGNGSPRVATYRLALGATFASIGGGTWTISMNPDAVFDILGNAAPAGPVGSFNVADSFAELAADGRLVLNGTGGADAITLSVVDDLLVATLNGQSLAFDRADVLAVVVHGNAGGDTLELSNTAPTIEYTADGGDDTIRVLAGTLTLGGADVGSDGGADGGGVRISVAASASVVFTSDQHLAGLTLLGDATAWIAGDVGASFMLVVGDLALDPAATLDVGAGAMIVHNLDVGWADGSGAYGGLTQYVASAYQFGAWTGPGLTSRSAADSDGLTGVGIGLASSILGLPESDSEGAWRGESVNGNSVLITYAYTGDADLNGYVDAADYGLIDNFVQFPGTSGYFLGDFNFDGIIDASDYGVIDNSIQLQGPPLA